MLILKNNVLRLPLLVICWLFLIVQRLSAREFYGVIRPPLRQFLRLDWVSSVLKTLEKVSPIKLLGPDLYIKILYIVMQQGLTIFILWLYFKGDKYLLRISVQILAGWFFGSFALNLLGKLLHNQVILNVAHTTIDFLFTPMSEFFLIPVLMLARAAKKQRDAKAVNQ